jgi:hypothetical protein
MNRMDTRSARVLRIARLAALAGVASLAISTLAATRVRAQGLGLALGTMVPQGDLGKGAKSGFVAIPSLEIGGRIALRIEGLWANSDLDGVIIHKSPNGVPVPDNANVSGSVKLVGGLGTLVLNLGSGPLHPYVLAGVGWYHRSDAQHASGAVSDISDLSFKSSDVGYDAGVGIKLSLIGVSVFAEARYHTVSTSNGKTNFIPLVVGLRL